MSKRTKRPSKGTDPEPTGVTAKQKAGLAALAKAGALEPLLRDLATHIQASRNKH